MKPFFIFFFLLGLTLNSQAQGPVDSNGKSVPVATTQTQNQFQNSQSASPLSLFNSPNWDRIQPGWNPYRFKNGIGYTTSFLGTGAAVVWDSFIDEQSSYSILFGMSKSADSHTVTSNSSVSGTATITTTNSTTYSGTKNPYLLSFGSTYYKKIYRNEWIFVRWGGFAGLDYYMDTSYPTGTRSESVVSTSPTTTSITESSYGNVKVNRATVFKLGPAIDTFVFLRWFPQLAVGFQSAILYSTEGKTKTSTSTRSRSYTVVNGVDQSPTSDVSSENNSESQFGPSLSTFALGGTQFNLFGSFTLKYVW